MFSLGRISHLVPLATSWNCRGIRTSRCATQRLGLRCLLLQLPSAGELLCLRVPGLGSGARDILCTTASQLSRKSFERLKSDVSIVNTKGSLLTKRDKYL